jgi:regulator of RNase E activity RraA
MEVRTGDLLHGDENGITVIPREIADKVYAESIKVGYVSARLCVEKYWLD